MVLKNRNEMIKFRDYKLDFPVGVAGYRLVHRMNLYYEAVADL